VEGEEAVVHLKVPLVHLGEVLHTGRLGYGLGPRPHGLIEGVRGELLPVLVPPAPHMHIDRHQAYGFVLEHFGGEVRGRVGHKT
jgi:hypothetical protein